MGLNRLFRQQQADDTEDDRRDGDHGADDAKHKTYDTKCAASFHVRQLLSAGWAALCRLSVLLLSVYYIFHALARNSCFLRKQSHLCFLYIKFANIHHYFIYFTVFLCYNKNRESFPSPFLKGDVLYVTALCHHHQPPVRNGGREIGKALGAALGVPVYDRELLEEAARTYCIPVSVMERNDETAPSRVLESFALSAPSLSMLTGAVDYSTIVTSDTTFAWQSATIRRLSKEGPCVIIGRCADHVLRGTPGVVSLFLYADYEARVDHITQKYQLSRGDATILIDETEKERARYYKRHTGQEFARMENYDLCLNTASVNREMAILLLKAFVENQEN